MISEGLLPTMRDYDFQNPPQKASIFPTEGFPPPAGQDRVSQRLADLAGKQQREANAFWATASSSRFSTELRAISAEVHEGASESSAKWPLRMSEPASLQTALDF
jgi:hypothetical protein